MKRIAVVALCVTVTGFSCAVEPNDSGGSVLELTSGTSFGMCGGYCVTELRIDSGSITLTETSQAGDMPARVRTLPLSRTDWERLRARVDTAAFRALEGVHGCPDCADGGAEWIQLETTGPIRVTFEFGAVLEEIAELQGEIRELRARFEP